MGRGRVGQLSPTLSGPVTPQLCVRCDNARVIYLDHAATAPPDPRVVEAMLPHLTERFGNPSEPHALGRQARADLDAAREEIASLVGADPADVVLTGGGTEADNLAVLGRAQGTPGRMVVSAIEHPAVRRTAEVLARRGWEIAVAPVLPNGRLDLIELWDLVQTGDALVCVMGASNVTGVVQPIADIAAICAEHAVPLHVDHIQTAAGAELDLSDLPGRLTIALAAHKLGGPRGVGAVIGSGVQSLDPIVFGGGQEGGLRSGTEDVAGAVALAAALRIRQGAEAPAERSQRAALRDDLEARLGLPVVGAEVERLPGHALLLTGYRGDTVVRLFDERGIAISAGSACASGETLPDATLTAMDINDDAARSAIRITLGPTTTAADIDAVVAVWAELAPALQLAAEASA